MDLRPLEQRLVDHARRRETLDLDRGEKREPGELPVIRGEAISAIAHNVRNEEIGSRGIHLIGARISGMLDLEHTEFGYPLMLERCVFEQAPVFEQARVKWFSLKGSSVPGLRAYQLQVEYDAYLGEGFVSTGPLQMSKAVIGGDLGLDGCSLPMSPDTWALDLRKSKIGGDLRLAAFVVDNSVSHRCAAGRILLDEAQVQGNVLISAATIQGPDDGYAVSARRTVVKGDVRVAALWTSDGKVRLASPSIHSGLDLSGARINGNVELAGGQVTAGGQTGSGTTALNLDQATVGGDVSLVSPQDSLERAELGLRCGPISLVASQVKGNVVVLGASITGNESETPAVNGERATIKGELWMRPAVGAGGFRPSELHGELRLVGARVGGYVLLAGLRLVAGEGSLALDGAGLEAAGDVVLGMEDQSQWDREPVTTEVTGWIRLTSARIGGHLSLTGSSVVTSSDVAVDLETVRVAGNAWLGAEGNASNGIQPTFHAKGAVVLVGAHVAGTLGFLGATLLCADPTDDESVSLGANLLSVGKGIFWEGVVSDGKIDLSYSDVGILQDDHRSWPDRGKLQLEGFSYQKLISSDKDLSVHSRLDWLARQPDYNASSFDRLSAFYLQMGDEMACASVAIDKQKRRAAAQGRRQVWQTRIYDKIVGCGYRPMRAFGWLALLWVVTAALLWVMAQTTDAIVPGGEHPVPLGTHAARCTSSYPCFSAAGYSAETVVPLINLHQLSEWRIDTRLPGAKAVQIYLWLATGIGWVLTTAGIAALTGILRRGSSG